MQMFEKLTPRQTVRAYCAQCIGLNQFNVDDVHNCTGDAAGCPFFDFRMGKRVSVKVMRAFCIDCMGGQASLVNDCPAALCPVHPYRMGRNPSRAGQGRSAAQMKKVRESKKIEPGLTIRGAGNGWVMSP